MDSGLLARVGRWASFVSRQQADDAVIRTSAAPRQQTMNQGQAYADYGGQVEITLPNIVTRGAADVGLAAGSVGFFPAIFAQAERDRRFKS